MYRLYAGIQNAGVVRVPLLARPRLRARRRRRSSRRSTRTVKIVFICSPNNPTGQSMARADIERICRETAGRALVVIDEAYHEFADAAATFSSCAIATSTSCCCGRCRSSCRSPACAAGLIVGAPELIEFAQVVLPPYTFPTPSIELVLAGAVEGLAARVRGARRVLKRERARLVGGAARRAAGRAGLSRATPTSFSCRTRDGQAFRETARRAGHPRAHVRRSAARELRAHHRRAARATTTCCCKRVVAARSERRHA